jgi:hypothetical protein
MSATVAKHGKRQNGVVVSDNAEPYDIRIGSKVREHRRMIVIGI